MKVRRRKKQGDKIKLSNSLRFMLILLSIVVIAVGSGNLIKSFNEKTETVTNSTAIYRYDNRLSSDTKINLKDNEYVNEVDISDGQTYLSDLISNIDMQINYQYVSSDTSKIYYDYKIEAITKATYTNTKNSYEVLNKVDTIKEVKDASTDSYYLELNEGLEINYARYHQTIKEFKQSIGINADSNLYIRLTVHTKTNINTQDVENEYVWNYKISLGDKVALIDEKPKDETTKTIKADEKQEKVLEVDYKGIIASIVLIVAGAMLAVFVLKNTQELKAIRNNFKLELNRILKSYEDKIVEIQDLNNFDIEKATRVKDVLQLRKLAEEALVPIYCYITEEEAYFIVSKYDINYIFILK